MARNTPLGRARTARQDEFYTQLADIENELRHYADHFRDKVVYCNCDDPVTSEFWRFFVRQFRPWGLRKLLATHYEPGDRNVSYSLELTGDVNGDGRVDMNDEPTQTPLECNGDFRSAACIELLRQADIVVTNPPFSLFREYVAQLMEYDKKFLIIGSYNAAAYKDFFPLIQNNRLWLGYGFNRGNAYFRLPAGADTTRFANGVYNPETGLVKFRSCCWYTNLDIQKRHEPIDLHGNYYYGNESRYPSYDNYDAIEVSRIYNIPCDYYGVMGVPITFLDRYCPEQFEIIGIDRYTVPKEFLVGGRVAVNGKPCYARILIRRRGMEHDNHRA